MPGGGTSGGALDVARQQLDEVGCCVVEDALDPVLLERLRARVVKQAPGGRAVGVAHLEWDGANQRIWFLLNKGRVFQDLLLHPLVEPVMSHLLGRSCTGRNLTDEKRCAILSYHCRPFLRQQESPFLTLDPEVLASSSDELRARTGCETRAGLGKTVQGRQAGDVLVDRVDEPVTCLSAEGRPLGSR